MTTLSAFLFWVGANGSGVEGVVVISVGATGVLFFGLLTVHVISEMLRIRRIPRADRRR